MSFVCSVCNKPVDSEKSDCVKCTGTCGNYFHIACVKDETDTKKTRSQRDFKCKDCRSKSTSSKSSSSVPGTAVTTEFLVKIMEQFKQEVFGEIKSLKNELSELSTTVQFVSDKLDSSTKLMEAISTELAALKKENGELRNNNARLSSEVEDLKERMRTLEQYTRRNNLEISGIPVTASEDVVAIVQDVGSALGIAVEDSEVSAAHRIPSYRQDRTPSIVVQFHHRTTRDSLIAKFREKKSLCASKVNSSFTQQKVYVNEHLSPNNKLFLTKLKQKCREVNYSFVWCREGKFFVRKSPGDRAIKISSFDELKKLK
jgi:DNA gyrase/topoisomerase IV subunit A